jgi:hypothetical protein
MHYLDHIEGDGRLLFEQIVAMDLGGDCLQAEGFALQSHREAIALFDQDQEFAVQPTRRARRIVRTS